MQCEKKSKLKRRERKRESKPNRIINAQVNAFACFGKNKFQLAVDVLSLVAADLQMNCTVPVLACVEHYF